MKDNFITYYFDIFIISISLFWSYSFFTFHFSLKSVSELCQPFSDCRIKVPISFRGKIEHI